MATAASTQPIVVGIDGSSASKVAIDWAARTAALRGVALKLVHVLNPPVVMAFPEVPVPSGYLQWQEEEGRRVLAAAAAAAGRWPVGCWGQSAQVSFIIRTARWRSSTTTTH
ncbi:universal stress protein [Mycolicibacterium sp.]|uniref:universal stress protein n=1 Tax=Mycolicibacterium sp. TaxID=2320850 RepID=UPI0025E83A76|nr:universal stress protein [Mycolicibacterium sp.]